MLIDSIGLGLKTMKRQIELSDIEISIICAFHQYLYLTNSEMADILIVLANKLYGKEKNRHS